MSATKKARSPADRSPIANELGDQDVEEILASGKRIAPLLDVFGGASGTEGRAP